MKCSEVSKIASQLATLFSKRIVTVTISKKNVLKGYLEVGNSESGRSFPTAGVEGRQFGNLSEEVCFLIILT